MNVAQNPPVEQGSQLTTSSTTTTPWRTVDQAAARALVGRRTIYKEIAAGRLRACRVGGRRKLLLKDSFVDEWLESQAATAVVRR